jgi:hypothetical protein
MEPTRDRLAESLREHSEKPSFGEAPTRQILAAGHRLRRRRAAMISGVSVAAVVAIAGTGWALGETQLSGGGGTAVPVDTPTSAAASSPNSDASDPETAATTAPPAGVGLTSCGDLPRFDADSVDDYTVDAQNGIVTFGLPTDSGVRTVNVAYRSDRECRDHPDVSRILTLLERLGSL